MYRNNIVVPTLREQKRQILLARGLVLFADISPTVPRAFPRTARSNFRLAQEEFRNSPELFRDLAFSVWTLRLPQFDRIPLRVMQASEPAVGIRLRVNLDRDSRSL